MLKLKKMSFMLPLIVIVILALALTGCGGVGTTSNADNPLIASAEAMANVDSYAADMVMDMTMASQGFTMDMDMTSDIKCIVKPSLLMSMDYTMTMPLFGDEPMQSSIYIEQTDTGLILYNNENGAWTKSELPIENMEQYMNQNPADMIALYQDNLVSSESLGEEAVNGQDCYKINVTISSEAFMALMNQMGNTDMLGMTEEELAANQELLAAGGDLTTTLWISKSDNMLLKQSMDLSQFMTNIINASAGEGQSVDEMTMTLSIEYHDYNAIDEIVIPAEAKNASAAS
jgi:hypothetical protein